MIEAIRGLHKAPRLGAVTAVVVIYVLSLVMVSPGTAMAASSWWRVDAMTSPSSLHAGEEGQISLVATNMGYATVEGSSEPITVTTTLPQGLTVTKISGIVGTPNGVEAGLLVTSPADVVNCEEATLKCTYAGPLPPYESVQVRITVKVSATVTTLADGKVEVSGGALPTVTKAVKLAVSDSAEQFGADEYNVAAEDENGETERQAGKHPFQLTTVVGFNTVLKKGQPAPVALAKNVEVDLPPGLVGNPTQIAECSDEEFTKSANGANECPRASAVGVVVSYAFIPYGGFPSIEEPFMAPMPVFNLRPATGEPARFGFTVYGVPVVLDTHVRTGSDYGVVVKASDVNQAAAFLGSIVTIWGVPGDARHDNARGWECVDNGLFGELLRMSPCPGVAERNPPPFLTMPTACDSTLTAELNGESWPVSPAVPGIALPRMTSSLDEMSGCNQLKFHPQFNLTPDTSAASSASGMAFNIHVSQEDGQSGNGLADSAVRNTTVVLPEGVSLNPGGADGLGGCANAAMEFEGKNGDSLLFGAGLSSCPDASKVGTVTIRTPLLAHPLEGAVYLASPNTNPFGSLVALYIVAEDPVSGVLLKLAGEVHLDPRTGRVSSTFANTPELPFEDLTLHFFGGPHAPLATPTLCGTYTTSAVFTPWSGNASVDSSSHFTIDGGPSGSSCLSSPGPFAPGFMAGTQNNAAGSFSPFVMNLSRKDGEQVFSTVALNMPLGLAGDVSAVTLCPEAEANAGTCPASSKIGHVRVSAGVGKEPIVLPEAGKPEDPVYLTGPYKGTPFGLSVVVPAEAGPFNLDENGHPIVVRAKIEINPYNAQVTVVSDPQPTRLQGIPLDVRDIEVVVDKPNFMFNPTSCAPTAVGGTIGSAEGADAAVSSRFQAADCASLPFDPGFSVLTQAHHTRFGGDSLHVVVKSAQGQVNLREVHVELPKVLPSRLSTLNLACPEATFAANPASCPAGSRVGVVTAQTPILSVPITGPAYFVSHGGAKFPELIFVLQGEGVTVQLNGETFISSKGITSSTFKTLPDVPVSRVDVVLPAGKDSVLTGTGDLCKHPLYMPTTLTGQNGAVIKKRTRIAVAGCKPELIVLRHHVKGATATIVVKTPSAGRLVASGRGLSRAVRRLRKAGVATLRLTLTKTERRLLARHHGRKLKVRVALRFTPRRGHVLTRSVTVLIG